MNDVLGYLVKSIIDQPDKARVTKTSDQSGAVILEISVDPTDMGKVIGKGGKIIKALRDLIRVLAVKQNRRVNVVLKEG